MLNRCVLALLFVFTIGASARAGELEERAEIEYKVIDLVYSRDFAGLEAMADTGMGRSDSRRPGSIAIRNRRLRTSLLRRCSETARGASASPAATRITMRS
jgi:hypothetical protein